MGGRRGGGGVLENEQFSWASYVYRSLYKSCTIFIRSSPLLFELTYIVLQNICINNGVANGLNLKKEKNNHMQTALYGKIKEGLETGGEWLIGVNIQNMSYLSFYNIHLV